MTVPSLGQLDQVRQTAAFQQHFRHAHHDLEEGLGRSLRVPRHLLPGIRRLRTNVLDSPILTGIFGFRSR